MSAQEELRQVHQELATVRARQAALEARIKLGRDLTAGTGPGGSLTRADVEKIARDPAEYDLRRDEVLQWMANPGPRQDPQQEIPE